MSALSQTISNAATRYGFTVKTDPADTFYVEKTLILNACGDLQYAVYVTKPLSSTFRSRTYVIEITTPGKSRIISGRRCMTYMTATGNHRMREHRMSDCENGCKIYRCARCYVEHVFHSRTYGCHK